MEAPTLAPSWSTRVFEISAIFTSSSTCCGAATAIILMTRAPAGSLPAAAGAAPLTLTAGAAPLALLAAGADVPAAPSMPRPLRCRKAVARAMAWLARTVSDTVRASQAMALATAFLQRSGRGMLGAAGTSAPAASNASGAAPAVSVSGAAPAAAGSEPAGARVINMMAVAAPQQVLLEVKIAEISKTLVDQLGASVGASISSGNWTYTFLSKLLSGNNNVADGFNSKNGNFLTLDAQKNDGLIKVLAEPTLMAISGQEASFLAGGKIFIPVAQGGGTGGTTITLEEKEFGIAVKFTPTVLEGGRINLRVAPEVSDLNPDGVGITSNGVSTSVLPSFTTRRASTTVQLFDGQSFAIGGLIKNNTTTNIKAFPGLGEIPVLGALFRSTAFQSDRTELVFIVTPHLAKPLAPEYKLPTDGYVEPTRTDYLLRGKIEGQSSVTLDAQPAATPAPSAPAVGFDVK